MWALQGCCTRARGQSRHQHSTCLGEGGNSGVVVGTAIVVAGAIVVVLGTDVVVAGGGGLRGTGI